MNFDAKTGKNIENPEGKQIPPATQRVEKSVADGWRYRITDTYGVYEASRDGKTWTLND